MEAVSSTEKYITVREGCGGRLGSLWEGGEQDQTEKVRKGRRKHVLKCPSVCVANVSTHGTQPMKCNLSTQKHTALNKHTSEP